MRWPGCDRGRGPPVPRRTNGSWASICRPLEELTMFELRVLSGLHRGAALPLVGEQWVVGAAEDADLALYDPRICGRHMGLRQVQGQWLLELLEGTVCDGRESGRGHV